MFFKEGKLLLGLRANSFDGNLKYSTVGGFVDNFETFAETISREIYEEASMTIPPTAFTTANLFCFTQGRSTIKEQADMPIVSAVYVHHLDDAALETLAPTTEFSEFIWVNEKDLDELYKKGKLAFAHNYNLAKKAFAEGWHEFIPLGHPIHERY